MGLKYSFMSFSTPEQSLDEMLETALRFGYDGVEPRVQAGHKHGLCFENPPTFLADARKKATEKGVAIACLATSCQFSNPETVSAMLDDARRAVDLASDLGSSCVRVFGGKTPDGVDQQRSLELITLSLQTLASHAANRAVVVCLETHDDWCDPKLVAEIMRRVGHPNVGVNWDVMHPVLRGFATIEESFRILRPWIRHLHVHDGAPKQNGSGVDLAPMGLGQVNHRKVIELLLGAPYQGFVSGEWINFSPWEEHLPAELDTLRRYERELGEGLSG
jgi:sugar phosphate isomerase/epimerase